MSGLYLSTNLITERNLTLADIEIDSFTFDMIESMESELIGMIYNVKLIPLLIDPKAEMKRQRKEDNPNTLVDFDQISQRVAQAKILHLEYLIE